MEVRQEIKVNKAIRVLWVRREMRLHQDLRVIVVRKVNMVIRGREVNLEG